MRKTYKESLMMKYVHDEVLTFSEWILLERGFSDQGDFISHYAIEGVDEDDRAEIFAQFEEDYMCYCETLGVEDEDILLEWD